MHPDDTALPIEFGSLVPWMRNKRVLVVLKQVERARAERILHAPVHMHRQARLPRQHFRRRRPSGPERLAADLGLALPGEALAPDPDPVLQRPPVAQRQIELAFAGVDGERARRLAGRIADLLAGRAAHVDVFVEASRGRIVRIGVRGQIGLGIGGRRCRARQGERKIEQGLRRRLVVASASAQKADQDETSRSRHG